MPQRTAGDDLALTPDLGEGIIRATRQSRSEKIGTPAILCLEKEHLSRDLTSVHCIRTSWGQACDLCDSDAPRRRWLILAAVPLLIDFSLTYFGVWSNTHLTRFLTGALLGAVAVFYVMPGLVELSSAFARRFGWKKRLHSRWESR